MRKVLALSLTVGLSIPTQQLAWRNAWTSGPPHRLKHTLAAILLLMYLAPITLAPRPAVAADATYTLVGAGDIASSNAWDEATAQLLDYTVAADPTATVFAAGDNAYPDGTTANFNDFYAPTWGRHLARTRPALGNHEYHLSPGTDYFNYFCPSTTNCAFPGGTQQDYYSYNLGNWHIVVLNSQIDYQAGSTQLNWLKADLGANPGKCTAAIWHKPYYSSGIHGSITSMKPFWDALYAAKADVVINGHDHLYERFAKQNTAGQTDPTGIREFIVGTGGASLESFGTIQPNSEVRNNTDQGVIKFSLSSTGYSWEFMPVAGKTFTDSGSATCNNQPTDAYPSVSITSPSAGATATGNVTVSADATDNNGVAGVQFKLDGNNLGAEVTSAPYQVAWDTTAATTGLHRLTAVVRDTAGQTATAMPVTVTVDNVPGTVLERHIASSTDDAEESATGSVNLTSPDLELVYDGSNQNVGMRFASLQIPRGATILKAYVQYTAYATGSTATTLNIRGEASDNSATFTTATGNVSTRPRTAAGVNWQPAAWTLAGEAGLSQRTPDLSALVAEVTGRAGWNSGNAMSLLVTGTGKRTAFAYNSSALQSPLLHVEYTSKPDTQAPTAPSSLTASAVSSSQISLSWSAATDNIAVTGYQVFRDGTQVTTTNNLSYNDTGLAPGTTYHYLVKAIDPSGNLSDPSPEASATTPQPPTTLTFAPTDDATVKYSSPSKSYGGITTLFADSGPDVHSLLKFNVSGIAGRQIVSAKLQLYCIDSSPTGGSFYRVADTSWTESTVTWNTAPAADTTAFASLGSVGVGGWYDVNLLPLITGDGTWSMLISTTSTNGAGYSSKEAGTNAPRLVITVQ